MIIHYRVVLCMVHSIIILKRTEWRSSFMKKTINLYSPASKKAYLIHTAASSNQWGTLNFTMEYFILSVLPNSSLVTHIALISLFWFKWEETIQPRPKEKVTRVPGLTSTRKMNMFLQNTRKLYHYDDEYVCLQIRTTLFMRAGDVQYLCRLFIKGN